MPGNAQWAEAPPMPVRSMLIAEVMSLRALSELDQLEGDWMGCIETGDPIAIAKAVQLLGSHLLLTLQHLEMAVAISEAELVLSTPVSTADPCQRVVNGAESVNEASG